MDDTFIESIENCKTQKEMADVINAAYKNEFSRTDWQWILEQASKKQKE